MTTNALLNTVPERDFQAAIIDLGRRFGWEVWFTYDSRHSPEDEPDLRMCRPPRYIVAELKKQNGRVSPGQRRALALLKQCPGIEAYLWRPSDRELIERVLL